MTDDLVKRLRYQADTARKNYPEVFRVSEDIAYEAADRIEKLTAALKNIADGDIPRTVKTPFRDDGKLSKHDRCEHGQWMYEECGCCIEDYARKEIE
jgi:hypothetical protein